MAYASAVKDHPVAEVGPFAALDELGDRELDLHRILFGGPLPAPDQPAEMGVNGDAGNVEGISQDDVGGLSADAGQRDEFIQRRGHLAVEPFHQFLAQPHQRVRLVPVEPGGADDLFELCAVGLRVVQRGAVLLEQCGGGEVHALVGALGRENRRDGQLEGIREVQLAVHMRKCLCQRAIHSSGPADETEAGLAVSFAGALGHSHKSQRTEMPGHRRTVLLRTGGNS